MLSGRMMAENIVAQKWKGLTGLLRNGESCTSGLRRVTRDAPLRIPATGEVQDRALRLFSGSRTFKTHAVRHFFICNVMSGRFMFARSPDSRRHVHGDVVSRLDATTVR